MAVSGRIVLIAFLSTLLVTSSIAHDKKDDDDGDDNKVEVNAKQGVTYDGRSVIVNGKRELLFSGSIHYPRSTPNVWIFAYIFSF